MAKFIQDGNLVGRIGALAFLAAAAVLLCRITGTSLCPLKESGSCCFFSSAGDKTAPK